MLASWIPASGWEWAFDIFLGLLVLAALAAYGYMGLAFLREWKRLGAYSQVAGRNLIQARRRSLLLGLVFAFVTFLLVFMLSLAQGITENMIKSGTTLSTGHVNIAGFFKARSADAIPLVTHAPEVRKIVEENTPGLSYVLERGRGWAKMVSETGSQFAAITSINPKEETHLAQTLTLAKVGSYHDNWGIALDCLDEGRSAPKPDDAEWQHHMAACAADLKEFAPGKTKGFDGYSRDIQDAWTGILAGPEGVTRFFASNPAAAINAMRKVIEPASDERLGDLSKLGMPGSIVMFASQAKKLGVRVGDVLTLVALTGGGTNNSADVTIAAICEDIGLLSMFSTFTSRKTSNELYQLKDDTTGAVQIYLNDIDNSDSTMEHLREVFEKKGYKLMDHDPNPFFIKIQQVQGEDWQGQKIDVTTWHDEVSFLAKVVTGLNWVSVVMIGFLIMIIGVGIMNTLWMSIRERTGEIGTLRAIGLQRDGVLVMFVMEAMLLAAATTAVGALLSCGFMVFVDRLQIHIPWDALRFILISDTLHLVIVPWQVALSVVVFTAVAALAALFPSTRAARMQPVTAIQNVD